MAITSTLSLRDNPTQEQKKVYKFYKSRHSHDADEIYSSEWFGRIVQFRESTPLGRNSSELLDDLEFGAFFLSHPVPAFSLWLLLNACYDLDRKVCSNISDEVLQQWRDMKPFAYLKSEDIQDKWRESLQSLREKMSTAELGGEMLIQELYDMVSGIQRMETALADLRDSIKAVRRDKVFLTGVLDLVGVAIDGRCEIIAAELEDGKSPQCPRNERKRSHKITSQSPENGSSQLLLKNDVVTESGGITDVVSPRTAPNLSLWAQEVGFVVLAFVAWTVIWNAA